MTVTALTWKIESSYGEFVAGEYAIPFEEISLNREIESYVDSGLRGASDAHDYASIPTTGRANAEIGGIAYQEILGDLLLGIMGQREAYGEGYEYRVSDSPPSFSIQAEDIGYFSHDELNTRLIHRYSGCMLKELEIVLSTQDALRWRASFVGQGARIIISYNAKKWAESVESWDQEINAKWDGTDYWGPHSPHPESETVNWTLMPSETPLLGWSMNTYFGDAEERENVTEIAIRLFREEITRYSPLLANPSRVYLGPLGVTFDITLQRDDEGEEERYESKIQEKVRVVCSSDASTLTFRATKTDFGDGAMEEDRSETNFQLTYHCRALYNSSDSGPCIFRLE